MSDPVIGFADIHAHPAAHLSFGADPDGNGGMFWGKPGLGLGDNSIAADLAQWPLVGLLGDGLGLGDIFNDPVRKLTRQTVFQQLDAARRLPRRAGGWPTFDRGDGWPSWHSPLHQQMHITWVHRAYMGGLRLMFASVTDNQLLNMLWHRHRGAPRPLPDQNHDYNSARRQLAFIRQQAEANASWMQVVTTPAEARAAIQANKLAVVLSLEMDTLNTDQILLLKREFGVGQVIPIHLVDNVFGGTAVYEDLFNSSNFFVNGRFFSVTTDPNLGKRLTKAEFLKYHSHDAFKSGAMMPEALGTLSVHGYDQGQGGHRNYLGLVQSKLERLMAEGLMVDVVHMSHQAQLEAIELAEKHQYPVMNSHTGLRRADQASDTERAMTTDLAQRLGRLGGVIGVGTGGPEPYREPDPDGPYVRGLVEQFKLVAQMLGGRGVALGTDMNGFAPQVPLVERNIAVNYPVDVARRYGMALEPLGRHTVGSRTFDIAQDGLAHYGLLPDLLHAASQVDSEAINPVFRSAEDTIQMWEKTLVAAERVRETWRAIYGEDDFPVSRIKLTLLMGEDGIKGNNERLFAVVATKSCRWEFPINTLDNHHFYEIHRDQAVVVNFDLPEVFKRSDIEAFGVFANLSGGTLGIGAERVQVQRITVDCIGPQPGQAGNLLDSYGSPLMHFQPIGDRFGFERYWRSPQLDRKLQRVWIKTASGRVLRAEKGGNPVHINGSPTPEIWETFDWVNLGGNKITLRTYGMYFVYAENGGGGAVKADLEWLDPAGIFEVVEVGGGFALKTANGHFVSIQGGRGVLTAVATGAGPNETFVAIPTNRIAVYRWHKPGGGWVSQGEHEQTDQTMTGWGYQSKTFQFYAFATPNPVPYRPGQRDPNLVAVNRWHKPNAGWVTMGEHEASDQQLIEWGYQDKTPQFFAYKTRPSNDPTLVAVNRWHKPGEGWVTIAENENSDAQMLAWGYTDKVFQFYVMGRGGLTAVYRWYMPTKKDWVTLADREHMDRDMTGWGYTDKTLEFYAHKTPPADNPNVVPVYRWFMESTGDWVTVADRENLDQDMTRFGYTKKTFEFYAYKAPPFNNPDVVAVYRWYSPNSEDWVTLAERENMDQDMANLGYTNRTLEFYAIKR